uniref:Uncharacterized protein n=1 Tax=Romanomermis culicivorax TaxID=13658 RepID=A0A915KQB3_ROMCU
MKRFDLNEYFVKSVGFKSDPDFNAENPFDGPDLNDEKAFKLVASPSQGKLCIIHPKVLRWITVAKQKLKELTDLTRRESAFASLSMTTASAFVEPVGDFLAATDSPSSGTTINERPLMMENVDQDTIMDNSSDISRLLFKMSDPSKRPFTTPSSLGKRGRKTSYEMLAENGALPAVPNEIRNERLDHRMTIGEALDYWWSEEGAKITPECYRQRVHVLVTIRSLYEPSPPSKQLNCRICWWCVRLYKQKISVWAMFVDETPRRTCHKCRGRFLRRAGCQTSFGTFWVELPRIFENCTGQDAVRRLISHQLCSRYVNNSYRIVNGQLFQMPSSRGRQTVRDVTSSSFYREEGEICADFSPPAEKSFRGAADGFIKPEILDISQEEENATTSNDMVMFGAEVFSSRNKNDNLSYVPEIYKNNLISVDGSAGVERHERKPDGCCWWCGVLRQKNLDLQYSLAFVDETPRLACEMCRKKCLDNALCITRIPDPDGVDPSRFVWWNLPPIYDHLSGRQALKQLSVDKLLFTKKKPGILARRKRRLPNGSKLSTLDFSTTKNPNRSPQQRRSMCPSGNSFHDASIPDVFRDLEFDGRQTIGQAADFWFDAARDAASDECMIARGRIICKIRSLHQGQELFADDEDVPFCWWCGDKERKTLRWCRGVFSSEVSRYICGYCYHFNYRHVGCVTKMPIQQENGLINYVWWHLPRIMENAERSTTFTKLRQIGVVHDHPWLSKKRSQNPSLFVSTSDFNGKSCDVENPTGDPNDI